MEERKMRKSLLEQLIYEMDRAELSNIPTQAEPETQKAEEMAGTNAVDGMKKVELTVEPDSEIEEDTFEKERDKRLSRAAKNLKSQMSFVK